LVLFYKIDDKVTLIHVIGSFFDVCRVLNVICVGKWEVEWFL